MNNEKGEEKSEQVQERIRRLREIHDDVEYVAMTLHVFGDDWFVDVMSGFAGHPDDEAPAKGVELRRARVANPWNMSRFWENADQGWISVNDIEQLAVFLQLRGNALMAHDIALEFFPSSVEPEAYAHLGALGFTPYGPDSREATKRRPRPRQRKRILDRDGHRCQMPDCQTSEDEQVELQVHHIRPVKDGGLTVDENLITLCSTCHNNLEPHFDHDLLWRFDSPARKAQKALAESTHRGGIEAHRRRLIALIESMDNAG